MDKLVQILGSPVNERSKKDVETLMPILKNLPLIKNNEFLQQSGKEDTVVEELCQVLTLYKLKAGQTVFRLGDYGNIFYIIINGTVSIHVKRKEEVKESKFDVGEEQQSKKILVEVAK